ncbi:MULTISPECIES: hypothetical protein [Halobacterium]|uniref:Bacterioopsin-associated protein n=4 Tax=Halobacterium salinarum TaxID=2242 RepID=Q9HPU4_HALSA|nr:MULTISPECIES: hypothetical protein [Halobacterium]AAG19773.1 hypothetical protein VNG_1468H [Halobacterium salinarum NRC-1]MBB6088776.1 hypothetical protein [Halobacterium salinarum]MCF2165285.1 hypothetical protein [Halobacterium salinarum]MCF2167906.1 hypothetical protein [Halobacterium salinarum]MCF2206324.1 hypothetical protein [Halobacterium salinarum]
MSPPLGLVLARSRDDGDADGDFPASLNRLAVVALAGAALVGAAGLFAVPFLRSFGMTFWEAFTVVGVSEFVSAIVAALAGYHLYTTPDD